MNVLKSHLRVTIETLASCGASHREIARRTGAARIEEQVGLGRNAQSIYLGPGHVARIHKVEVVVSCRRGAERVARPELR